LGKLTASSRLRIAIVRSRFVNEWQHHGKRRIRLDLSSGMRLAPLTNVADESRTMLANGLAKARTNGWSVIAALPSTFYRKSFLRERLPRHGVGRLATFWRKNQTPLPSEI
jgi:hypothetical protein